MEEPEYRSGIGDATGRTIKSGSYGYVEYRFAPGDLCEIVNLEVNNNNRREGVGRLLIARLATDCVAQRRAKRLYAITRFSNKIAREFYLAIGFRECAKLKGYYDAEPGSHDAVMYVMDL